MKDIKQLPLPIDIICGNDEEVNRVVKVLEINDILLATDWREHEYECLRVRMFRYGQYSIAGCDVAIPNQTPASQFLTDYEAV